MAVIAIYRLAIIRIKTTSLAKLNQLDTLDGKAEFYVFHVLPEWTALCILYTGNIRKTFSTGFAGDWRYTDKKNQAEEEEMTTRGENGSNDQERGSNVEGDRIKLLEQQHLEYARVQAVQLQATTLYF
ncbi:hypothetical protein D9613_000242 [Agrocybe pediades]|uniref:Uncharacterized protein n=1 Tax=Agrocybe pediades TaxID=84607 RepID=A0A8H4VSZ9_9AGAR|nr:hypothetical protein D9613_000242 [Agrocybe pediades]